MELQEIATRIWQDLLARPAGPLALRFVMQPIVATALALRDGARDARAGRTPHLWTIVSDRSQRAELLKDGLASVAKVIVVALVLDGVYQFIVLKKFYPFEAIIVAIALGYAPYLLIRGPTARIVRWWNDRRTPTEHLQP
ncbi:MAG TPA: hypothetical protein VFO35_07150 [Steroidobacteraceae bacterium]|nr:hypothetical protein [Steroidobacteraceae bacterium]